MDQQAKNFVKTIVVFVVAIILTGCSPRQAAILSSTNTDSPLLKKLLGQQGSFFDSILQRKDELQIQIIYSHVEQKGNTMRVKTHYFNVDTSRYFYPASAVKLPIAILALQRLHEIDQPGLNLYTSMITDADGDSQTSVAQDSTSANRFPSIAQYTRKIFLVSDNDAFNRLYEFLGQEYINNSLRSMGYTDAQIIHRLSLSLTEAQNRHTNPIRFLDTNGNVIHNQPGRQSRLVYQKHDTKLGKGYMNGQNLVPEPFDFSQRNRLSLSDLHTILQSVVLPETVDKEKRFNLHDSDYVFLRKYLSLYPQQSGIPGYSGYPDNYVKLFLFDTSHLNPGLRIYSKSGTAYGFLTDVAYVTDTITSVQFMLSATIYCNSDGIFNDDKYDYETIGYPFLSRLAQIIYEYEKKTNWKKEDTD
jgi:beta-lactamase class A